MLVTSPIPIPTNQWYSSIMKYRTTATLIFSVEKMVHMAPSVIVRAIVPISARLTVTTAAGQRVQRKLLLQVL